jgi:hypothetical protein
MKYALLLLSCLMLATPAWSDHDPALREIEKLIRLRDYSEAVTRLETLAHKGNTEAQYRLAGLYRTGKGVNRDLVEAQELYRRAALAGSPDAQFSLALLIEKLDGSRSEARRWYRKSAAQGDRRAAQKLEQYEGTIEAKNEGITGEEIFNAIRHNDEDLIISLIEGGANLDLIDRQRKLDGNRRIARWMAATRRHSDRQYEPLCTAEFQGFPTATHRLGQGLQERSARPARARCRHRSYRCPR